MAAVLYEIKIQSHLGTPRECLGLAALVQRHIIFVSEEYIRNRNRCQISFPELTYVFDV